MKENEDAWYNTKDIKAQGYSLRSEGKHFKRRQVCSEQEYLYLFIDR